ANGAETIVSGDGACGQGSKQHARSKDRADAVSHPRHPREVLSGACDRAAARYHCEPSSATFKTLLAPGRTPLTAAQCSIVTVVGHKASNNGSGYIRGSDRPCACVARRLGGVLVSAQDRSEGAPRRRD